MTGGEGCRQTYSGRKARCGGIRCASERLPTAPTVHVLRCWPSGALRGNVRGSERMPTLTPLVEARHSSNSSFKALRAGLGPGASVCSPWLGSQRVVIVGGRRSAREFPRERAKSAGRPGVEVSEGYQRHRTGSPAGFRAGEGSARRWRGAVHSGWRPIVGERSFAHPVGARH